jgi:hypothetical protein
LGSVTAWRTLEGRALRRPRRREEIAIDTVPAVVVIDRRQRGRCGTARTGLAAFVASDVADNNVANIVASVGRGAAGNGFRGCLGVVEIRLERGLFWLFGGGLFGLHILLFTSHKAITHPVAHKNDF